MKESPVAAPSKRFYFVPTYLLYLTYRTLLSFSLYYPLGSEKGSRSPGQSACEWGSLGGTHLIHWFRSAQATAEPTWNGPLFVASTTLKKKS